MVCYDNLAFTEFEKFLEYSEFGSVCYLVTFKGLSHLEKVVEYIQIVCRNVKHIPSVFLCRRTARRGST